MNESNFLLIPEGIFSIMQMKSRKLKKYIKRNPLIFWIISPLIFLRRFILLLIDKTFTFAYQSILNPVSRGSLAVNLKDFEGEFEFDFRSHILRTILKEKAYEPDIVCLVRQYTNPNMDVIDVGANIGLYTVLCSRLICGNNRVLAIEPAPEAIKYLYQNITSNNCSNVIIYEGIAIEKPQIRQFNIIPGKSEYSSAGSISHQAVDNMQTVSITVEGETIDNLVEKYGLVPGLIKLDIEGGEYSALMGATQTVQKYKPIILLEASNGFLQRQGSSSRSIEMLLQHYGYRVLNAEDNLKILKHPFDGEILAIP